MYSLKVFGPFLSVISAILAKSFSPSIDVVFLKLYGLVRTIIFVCQLGILVKVQLLRG